MNKKTIEFTAPKLEQYDRHGSYHDCRQQDVNPETTALLPALFAEIRKISPYYKNGARILHFCVDRGTIEEYGDYEDQLEYGVVENYEEFENNWKEHYPNEKIWFTFGFLEDNGYYAVFMNQRQIFDVRDDAAPNEWGFDAAELVQWLTDKVKEILPGIASGTYNERIRQELPPNRKFGTITWNALWEVYPQEKEDYFSSLSESDCNEFLSLMNAYDEKADLPDCLPEMTAGLFYHACKLGYAANHCEEAEHLSGKELYLKYADGRDAGLRDLPEESPEAFADWMQNHEPGAHPWEVCRGGNSTHVSLYVSHSEKGYCFYVDGKSWGRSVEAIHFYLAIRRAGLPVKIFSGKQLARRLTGSDKIGILPDGIFPRYCESYFPDEEILDFMNLPDENREQFIAKCIWRPEPEQYII